MKRMTCFALIFALCLTAFTLSGCGKKEAQMQTDGKARFGFGLSSHYGTPTDADGDVNGEGSASITVAAVFIGADGKIKKCVLDTAENILPYTSDGKYVKTEEFKTKREYGESYGMKAAGAAKEWYEQADVFESLVKGKSVAEVKRLLTSGGKGNDEVINAGCTIKVEDFVKAIENAVSSAFEVSSSEDDEIRLGVVTSQASSRDASDEEDGAVGCESTFFAALVDSKGVVRACRCDCVHAEIPFDENGEEELEEQSKLKSKRELGKDYGMKAAGAQKEWYEQADAFESVCIGKNADAVAKLTTESGEADAEVVKAGCTINVADLVRAALKALK